MNFDKNLSSVLFSNLSLQDFASLKQTDQHNYNTLSSVFQQFVPHLKELFQYTADFKLTLGDVFDDLKPYLIASILRNETDFKNYMNAFVDNLAIEIANNYPKDNSIESQIPITIANVELQNLLNDVKRFQLFEDYQLVEKITKNICEHAVQKKDFNALAQVSQSLVKLLNQPFHEESAEKVVAVVYDTLLKSVVTEIGQIIAKNPEQTDEILKEISNISFEFASENEIAKIAFALEENIHSTSYVPIKDKLIKDLKAALTPKNILETAYANYLKTIEDSLNISNLSKESIDSLKKTISTKDLLGYQEVQLLDVLDRELKNGIADHKPILERLQGDFLRIATKLFSQ